MMALLVLFKDKPIHQTKSSDSKSIAIKLKNVFGDRFFSEIMFTTNGNLPSWDRSIQLSEELKIPLVFTNDTHFVNKNDADLHLAFQNMKSYSRFNYDSKMLWLATETDMRSRVSGMGYGKHLSDYLEISMANSFLLAESDNSNPWVIGVTGEPQPDKYFR